VRVASEGRADGRAEREACGSPPRSIRVDDLTDVQWQPISWPLPAASSTLTLRILPILRRERRGWRSFPTCVLC
jgi:hypothetical protein